MILTITPNPTIDKVYFVDKFNIGKVHRPIKVACTAGGKGINVARVAHILGENVMAMGFIGGGSGEYVQTELQALGIETFFTRVKGETRTNVNISDKGGKSSEILEDGPEISPEEEKRFFEQLEKNLPSASIVCASGSIPKGLDSKFYCELIRIAKSHGKKIIADTGGKVLEEVISAKPYMIKPNEFELSQLFGKEIKTPEDMKKALLFLYEKRIEVPLITLGKDGAMAYVEGQFLKFNSPQVIVKNAVGSGDSTIGGIVAGLCRGMRVVDSIRLGMAAGTANTQFEETGFVSCELVQKYYKEVTVEVIK